MKRLVHIQKRIISYVLDIYHIILGDFYVTKHRKIKNTRHVIKVCFFVQMAELWDKQIKIYDYMEKDPRFVADIVVIPPFDFINKKVGYDYTDEYFFDKYPQAIRAYNNSKWFDPKKQSYDYVFYQRPYNYYLPRIYRSTRLVKYTRCCYVSYAFWPLKNSICGYNADFFSGIYFAFLESYDNAMLVSSLFKGKGKILFRGYPVLDNINASKNYDTSKVLWTPRWSYGESIGGSHFLEYKDTLIGYFKNNRNLVLTVRPHPLAFENYIANGYMTPQEVDDFVETVVRCGGKMDDNKLIEDTFETTGILISDISSIVYPFFFTAKPVIFCDSDVKCNPSFEKMKKGMYIANNEKELVETIEMLADGKDPLKEVREKIVKEIKADYTNSVIQIVDEIVKDWRSR